MRYRERRTVDDQGQERRRRRPEERAEGEGDRRAAAERLLTAGDDAIGRALSRDSRAFLAGNRQAGGQ